MPRIYKLQPTPKDHPFYLRPMYHTIRNLLLEARAKANGGLTKLAAPAPDFVNWTGGRAPIRDQGDEGCCSGFQSRNVRWLAHWLATGMAPPEDFSPAYPYWQARDIQGTQNQDSGATIGDELAGMEQAGICEERFMPYVVGGFATPPSQQALENAATHKVDLQAVPVDYSSFANIHQVLADRHPIIFGFAVPPSFESVGSDGHLPDPTGETSLGLHAGSADSCSLKDGWMTDPNSWGSGWGCGGIGFMPAQYLGRFVEAWAIVPVL
jgi:hypothetical protein